ncbi:MAG: ACP S-malonyltransferase, partial [Thermoleophilia bacterium]|nr:ACP S-malonyltransferase [Thermoleophilia bacterium]
LLGWDLRGLCLDGPIEELTRTDRAQPAIFVCSVAAWRVLEGSGVDFRVAVGHSLGEYSALVATGQLDFAACLRVVELRGAAMYACGREHAGTMAAIIGLADEEVDTLCAEVGDVWPANYNCPGQVVVSGRPEAVEAASRLARERGARRTLPLQVSGAFHTPLVAGAARRLADVLDGVAIHAPARGSFFSSTELRYPETDDIKETMVRQLTSPVRFSQSMGMLLGSLTSGLEVGPGAVLSGLVRRSSGQFPVAGTGDAASMKDALRRLTNGEDTGE